MCMGCVEVVVAAGSSMVTAVGCGSRLWNCRFVRHFTGRRLRTVVEESTYDQQMNAKEALHSRPSEVMPCKGSHPCSLFYRRDGVIQKGDMLNCHNTAIERFKAFMWGFFHPFATKDQHYARAQRAVRPTTRLEGPK